MNLETWLLTNHERLNFKSQQLSWIEEYLPSYGDFVSEISIKGRTYFGRGTKLGSDLSLLVSVAECLERAIALSANKDTSNGIAGHTDISMAKQNALHELVERDLFLSHYLSYQPLVADEALLKYIPDRAMQEITKHGCDISFYRMAANNLGSGLVCKISGRLAWGGILGMSFGNELDIENISIYAFLEAFRQYWHLKSKGLLQDSLTLQEFNSRSKWEFEDHRKLALNVNFFESISWLFGGERSCSLVPNYSLSQFEFLDIRSPLPILADCPLKIIQCKSDTCQNLYVGPSMKDAINLVSLSRFGTLESESINLLPHPLS